MAEDFDPKKFNPRVLCWLAAAGHDLDLIHRNNIFDDMKRCLTADGKYNLPWTFVYGDWVRSCWTVYRIEVAGCAVASGRHHWDCLNSPCYDHAAFDKWLNEKYPPLKPREKEHDEGI